MTRIMNFTAKPVRKQLRNRPKEKQKRANPQGNERIIPDQFSFLYCDLGGGMYFGKILLLFQEKALKMEEFYVCGSNFTEKRLYYRKR